LEGAIRLAAWRKIRHRASIHSMGEKAIRANRKLIEVARN